MTVTLSPYAFITQAEAREFTFVESDELEINDTDEDVFYRLVNGVCAAVESHCHRYFIIREDQVEYFDGGVQDVLLSRYPVVVSEVLEDAVALVEGDDYVVYPEEGRVHHMSGNFALGARNVKVTSDAGYVATIADVPEDVRTAALIWVRRLWKAEPENFTPQIDGTVQVPAHSMPSYVVALLMPYRSVT